MRIHFRSDIHLEVNKDKKQPAFPECDIRIVAGDIENSNYLKGMASENPECQIIGVLGNHDYWYTKDQNVETGHKEYSEESLPNLHILENSSVLINGVRFIGACLWGNGSESFVDSRTLRRSLNDFEWIKHGWSPQKMREQNIIAKKFIVNELKAHNDEPCVVVTHFPPMVEVLAECYRHNPSPITSLYYSGGMESEINKLIIDKFAPKLWIFGHSHSRVDKTIGDIRFMSNCLGYMGYEDPMIDQDLIVEI